MSTAQRVSRGFHRLAFLLAVLVTVSVSPAASEFDTGNSLYEYCESQDPVDQAICSGVVTGAFDMMQLWGWKCSNTQSIVRKQVKDVVIKYLQDHPEQSNMTANTIIVLAAAKAFNCSAPWQQGPK